MRPFIEEFATQEVDPFQVYFQIPTISFQISGYIFKNQGLIFNSDILFSNPSSPLPLHTDNRFPESHIKLSNLPKIMNIIFH